MEQDNNAASTVNMSEMVSIQRQQLETLKSIDMKNDRNALSGTGMPSGMSGTIANAIQSPAVAAALTNVQNQMDNFKSSMGMSSESAALKSMQSASSLSSRFVGGTGNLLSSIGVVAAGAWAAAGVTDFNRQNLYAQYAFQNSNQAINIFNSSNSRGIGGLSQTESNWAGYQMDQIARRNFMSSENMQSIVMSATDNGLLRGSSGAQEYVAKLESLARDTRSMAQAMNASIDEISSFFGALNKLVGTVKDGNNLLVQSKITGGIIGMDGTMLSQNILGQVSGMISGTGLSGSSVAAGVSNYQYLGSRVWSELSNTPNRTRDQDTTLNYLNNIGLENIGAMYEQSVGSMFESGQLTNFLAAAYNVDSNGNLVFSSDKMNRLRGMSMTDINSAAAKTLGSANASSVIDFQRNQAQYFMNDLTAQQQGLFMQYSTGALTGETGGVIDTKAYLMQAFGMSSDQAAAMAAMFDVDGTVQATQGNLSRFETIQMNQRAARGSLGENISRANSGINKFFTETINPFYGASVFFNSANTLMGNAWNDIWYGRQFAAQDLILNSTFYQSGADAQAQQIQDYNQQVANIGTSISEMSSGSRAFLSRYGITGENIGRANVGAAGLNAFSSGDPFSGSSSFGVARSGGLSNITAENQGAYRSALLLYSRGVTDVGRQTQNKDIRAAFDEISSQNISVAQAKEIYGDWGDTVASAFDIKNVREENKADAAQIKDNFYWLMRDAGWGSSIFRTQQQNEESSLDYLQEMSLGFADGRFMNEKFQASKIGSAISSDAFLSQSFQVTNARGKRLTLSGEQLIEQTATGEVSSQWLGSYAVSNGIMEAKNVLDSAITQQAAEDPVQAGIAKTVSNIEEYVAILAKNANSGEYEKIKEAADEADQAYSEAVMAGSFSQMLTN